MVDYINTRIFPKKELNQKQKAKAYIIVLEKLDESLNKLKREL